jgi:hypothetical protein
MTRPGAGNSASTGGAGGFRGTVPIGVPFSEKVTVPVGTPRKKVETGLTVAVNTNGCPNTVGFSELVKVVTLFVDKTVWLIARDVLGPKNPSPL